MSPQPDPQAPFPMGISRSRLILLAAIVLTIAILGLVCPLPHGSRAFNRFADLLHLPGFIALTAGAMKLSDRLFGESLRNRLLATAAVVFFGGAMEIVQGQVGRSASVSDFLTNAAGATTAFLILASQNVGIMLRILARSTALLVMLLVTVQPVRSLIDVRSQHLTPATLASFRNNVELERWYIHAANVAITLTDLNDSESAGKTLVAKFRPDKFPAVQLQHLTRSWSEYSAIAFDLARPIGDVNEPLKMQLNITAFAAEPIISTSYREVFELLPGDKRQITIPFAKIQQQAHPQTLDLNQIRYVEFMAVDLKQNATFQLANLRLIKPGDDED
jgi:VanZ family protein